MDDHIHVTCPGCNRGIRAPRAAAGRWGKCPSCHNKVYVPTPDDELEEIPLAPIDEQAERLEREARRVEAALLREKNTDQSGKAEAPAVGRKQAARRPAPASSGAESGLSATSISELILEYLVAMKGSQLPRADAARAQLAEAKAAARSRIEQLMVDAMVPPRLGDMPPALYLGFLKKLEQSLG